MGLVDYVMRRDRVDFIQAVKSLADIAGLQLPKGDFDQESYQKYKEHTTLLEDCNRYFMYCLKSSPEAENARVYLSSTRGFSDKDIEAMELGYYKNRNDVVNYLQKTHNKDLIDRLIPNILNTVNLSRESFNGDEITIPYRSGSVLKGFKFRTYNIITLIDDTPADILKRDNMRDKGKFKKYHNSKGLDKIGGFFNISGFKGNKDLIIVEGELDALHATVKGVNNVVATGGSSINTEQVRDAIKKGAKSFILCFDTEPGKDSDTAKYIHKAIEVILAEGVYHVYIVTLPTINSSKTDPDSIIRDSGVEAFNRAIAQAVPYWQYKLQAIIDKYISLHNEAGELTLREEDNFLDEVMIVASTLEPIDKDRYKKLFLNLEAIKELGISEQSLSITVDRLTTTRDKEAQALELQELLSKVKDYQDKGETAKALELLDKDLKNVRVKNIKGSIDKLKEIPTEEDIKLHFSQHSESLRSGYYINGNELLLPSGGLTGIAGATNHGKTDFLINLTLNAVKNYPDKEFYYFTYEMSQEAILVRFLNTFLDRDLEVSSNHRAIKTYFKTGSTEYIRRDERDHFINKVKEFFEVYINSGRLRVKGVDFYSPELNLALIELNKKDTVGGYFIDYFQLLRLPKEGYKNYSRQEELKVICQDLNDTAKSLQLPIILGAQFNREVTTPFRLHPTNIGEAGDIERILDTLIGIWNTSKTAVEKDMSKAETTKFKELTLDTPGLLYTYILKSRETATDVFELLNYNGKRGVISNQERDNSYFK